MEYSTVPKLAILSRSFFFHAWIVLIGVLCVAAPRKNEAALVTSFQAGDGGWQLGALAVGNIDSDAQLEIVVPYRGLLGLWFLDAFKANGAHVPGFPYLGLTDPINTSPTLFDLDGDGQNEILFTQGHKVVALNGNGSVRWIKSVDASTYVPNSGFQTVTDGFYWSGTRQWQPRLPLTSAFYSEVSPPIVADIDGQGKLEVLTAWKIDPDTLSSQQDYNPFIKQIFGLTEWGSTGETWSGGVVTFDARTGAQNFVYHFHQLVESGLALGQADADKPLEVYVLNDSDSVVAFDKTQPFGLYGSGMLHKQFGKNQRLLSGSYLTGVDVCTVDLDGDGLAEVLVPSTQIDPNWQPQETILDDDGAILWRKWKTPISAPNVNGWFNSATMIPVNPDHDNHIDIFSFTQSTEIAYRFWDGVKLVDHAGWPKNFAPYFPTPPVVGDVDGDGEEDVVIGTYDPAKQPSDGSLYVFSLNGTLKQSIAVPGGLKHIPALADVNADGSLDIVYRSLSGRIYIQNFGGRADGGVSWATHRGNMQRDGNYTRSLFPAGTPLITKKQPGFRYNSFAWRTPEGYQPDRYEIFRSEAPEGPFASIATLVGSASGFRDSSVQSGRQYIYEIAAVYGTKTVRSAPLPILAFLNNNLIANAGFEEDDNSHWDKWFTGDIPWDRMTTSTTEPYQGAHSMEIRLENDSNNSSITQSSHYGTPQSYLPVTPGKFYSFGGFFRSSGITQPSQHWLEWDSWKTATATNTRPALPWPNYFTPPFSIGTGATPWTYANRVFRMPNGFPNVELRHRYTIDQPGSGSIFIDNVFFRLLPDPNTSLWAHWIPLGSKWKYLAGPPPANWAAIDCSDQNWSEGMAKFGAGSGPANLKTALPPKQPAYYFRRTFEVPAGQFEELLLAATCTDNYGGTVYPLQVFLNGQEILSSGIEAVSGEGNDLIYYDLTPFLDRVHPGSNVIAVKLNNTWQPDWDNVAFDLSLRAILAGARFERTSHLNGVVTFDVSAPAGTSWKLESTRTPAVQGSWESVTSVGLDASGVASIRFNCSDQSRFYRLVQTGG